MPNYIRRKELGGSYFFTVVTEHRRSLLTNNSAREMLRDALRAVQLRHPFHIDAIVLLPDHLHAIWTLPDGDDEYSMRWGLIKEQFTRSFLLSGGEEASVSDSRLRHRERGIWQRRFWEHSIRDDSDFERCLDYIHWNPVKHKLVSRVIAYPWSSFHRYVARGHYDPHWGEAEVPEIPGAEWE